MFKLKKVYKVPKDIISNEVIYLKLEVPRRSSSMFSSKSFREVLLAIHKMLNILVVTVFSTTLAAESTLSKLLHSLFSSYLK